MFGGCDKPGAGRMAVCNGRVALCNRRTDGGAGWGLGGWGFKKIYPRPYPRYKHSSGYPQLPCPPTPFPGRTLLSNPQPPTFHL